MRDRLPGQIPRVTAVSKHRHAVGNRLHFRQTMRDIQDADPPVAELPDDAHQLIGFTLGQRGGRFVHDQYAGIDRQGLGNFHQLLLTNR